MKLQSVSVTPTSHIELGLAWSVLYQYALLTELQTGKSYPGLKRVTQNLARHRQDQGVSSEKVTAELSRLDTWVGTARQQHQNSKHGNIEVLHKQFHEVLSVLLPAGMLTSSACSPSAERDEQ